MTGVSRVLDPDDALVSSTGIGVIVAGERGVGVGGTGDPITVGVNGFGVNVGAPGGR